MSQHTVPLWRRRGLRFAPLGAVILVPLAFAGLFVGAVSQINSGVDRIPAAIVNHDELVTTTQADGTQQMVLAGRQLVTELTGPDSAGFEWTISNDKDAQAMLAAGKVYAVLEVPANFSRSITSLSTSNPQQAKLTIRTDDAHNYLTGAVAQSVGDGMVSTFGRAITSQYIAGIYSNIGALGGALASAADGAGKLSDGAEDLSSGLSKLSTGVDSAQAGAGTLAGGVGDYVGGVRGLAGGLDDYVGGVAQLATGLRGFESEIRGLDAGDVGVTSYTGGISQLSAGLAQAVGALDPNDPGYPAVKGLSDQLVAVSANGPRVVGGVNTAFDRLADGAGASAAGAEKLRSAGGELVTGAAALASSGAQLSSGASGLAAGLSSLKSGASQASHGAGSLANGAGDLASGLRTGADKVPTFATGGLAAAADVAAAPVGLAVTRQNEVSDPGQIVATLFVPLGLWVGSLAVFLVMRPVTRAVLRSTAGNGRILLSVIGRAGMVSAVQALLLVALLHIGLGVGLELLPATLLFAILMALGFTAFHYLLTLGLGRGGLVVSIFLLAVQITSTGGLYPIQLLATPFQVVSPFMPLTYGVTGMQAIIAGSDAGSVIMAALVLVGFGLLSAALSFPVLRRLRGARALGLVPTMAG